jgi:hypothetical protein
MRQSLRKVLSNLYHALHTPLLSFGSVVNVMPDCIPELDEGLAVTMNWTKDGAHKIQPHRFQSPQFLNEFIEILTLSVHNDKERALEFIFRSNVYSGEGIYRLQDQIDFDSLGIPELVNFFDTSDPSFLSSGFKFIE